MEQKQNNIALVVEGGAMRGIFAAGVLDGFLENSFNPFTHFYGVSAGALNLSSFLAGQHGRNYEVYMRYTLNPEFINLIRFLKGGHLIDIDWLLEHSLKEVPLHSHRIFEENIPFYVGVTNVRTARTEYFSVREKEEFEHILKASSALPLFYRSFPRINEIPMTDGGLQDPIPVQKAIDDGANKILVIRSRKKDYTKSVGAFDRLMSFIFRRNPHLSSLLIDRAESYNQTLQLIRNPPKGISILEICPPDSFSISRLSRSKQDLEDGYRIGVDEATKAISGWNNL